MSSARRNLKARLSAVALATLAGTLLVAGTAAAAAPAVVTGSAKEITRTSMTLCGTVDPEGEATTFDFVYEYYEAGWHPVTTASASAGEGATAVEECTNVTGLEPETRYGYRIAATNASGERSGAKLYVTTTPAVEELKTEPATALKRLGASSEVTLNGSLAPNGYDTHYYFEYRQEGLRADPNEDELSPVPPGDVGSESKLVHVSATVGVQTNVKYYFRLVGVNQFGTTTSSVIEQVIVPAVEGVETDAPTDVTATSALLNGTLEPNGYDTHWQFQCQIVGFNGANPKFMVPSVPADAGTANGPVAVSATVAQLAGGDPLEGNTKLSCKLVASNSLGSDEGAEMQLTTQKAKPAIEAGAETGVTESSAGVHADLQTENEATTYWVQYVDAADYDATAADPYESGSVTTAAEVGATPYMVHNATRGISSLTPDTTYHYRFVAENATGTTYGPDQTFTTAALTPPTVVAGSASGVSATSATISGTVNPEGLKTSYEFQIGETSSYAGAQIFGDAGEGGGDEAVSTTLEYLVPGTTYHYRLVATNVDGTTYGPDETFTTPAIGSPIGQPASTPLLNVTLANKFPNARESAATKSQTRQLARKQKLKKALAQCRKKQRSKRKRMGCEAKAKRKLGRKA